jgi:hypothetical protein
MSVVSHVAAGQSTRSTDAPEAALCFGFAFGPWTPALDWKWAGHAATLDSARVPRAPDGRGWAALDVQSESDTTLMLFPPWWPAGVTIALASKPAGMGDTVSGHAKALVADGAKRPPTSAIRAWLVHCTP